MKYTKAMIGTLLFIGLVFGCASLSFGQGGAPPFGGLNYDKIALLDWYNANQSGAGFGTYGQPHDMAFDGASMWMSESGTVVKLRAADGACIDPCKFTVPGYNWGIAFDGANIWVVAGGNPTTVVSKLRASDGVVVKTVTLASSSIFTPMAFDGATIWVGGPGNNVTGLWAANPDDPNHPPKTTLLDTTPQSMAVDGTYIWVAGSGRVHQLAPDGHQVQEVRLNDVRPNWAVAFDGINIWVTSGDSGQGNGRVYKLRASDGAKMGWAQVGNFPVGAAFDGANIWVGGCDSHSLTKVQPSNLTTQTFGTQGWCPIGLAFDGANIWAANIGGGVGKF